MLRAKPTQISLNSRDIDWHHVRHEKRQAQRAGAQAVGVMARPFPDKASPPQVDEVLLPYRFSGPSSAQLSPVRGLQLPTFSTDQDMRQYWSSTMANAGGLPKVQNVSSGRPVMINASPSSHSIVQASTVSFESEQGSVQDFDDDDDDDGELNYVSHPDGSDDDGKDAFQLTSETHSSYRNAFESGQKDEDYPRQSIHAPRRRRLSFSFYRRRAHDPNTSEQTSSPHLPAENADLDGPSDHRRRLHLTQSATESLYTTAQNSVDDDESVFQQLQAASLNSLQTEREVSHVSMTLAASSHLKGKHF